MAKGKRKDRKSKRPASPIALTTADWLGNTVVFSEKSWMHAQAKHGIKDLGVVEKAISSPMRVRESTASYAVNAFALETLSETTAQHIRVIVHYPEDADISTAKTVGAGKIIGIAQTAYPVDYTEASNVGQVIFESPSSTLPPPDKSK